MYALELVTPPASEPIDVATLKLHLRLNTDAEDTLLSGYITAARQLFEQLTDRQCITATYKLYLDAFPRVIHLPKAPLQSVTSVQYYDSNDNLVTWDSNNYSVDNKREPGRIGPKVWFPDWKVFPVYPPISYKRSPKIIVEFVAGWTTLTIPQLVKQALLLQASHYYQRRESQVEANLTAVQHGFRTIVDMYKLGWITNMNRPQFPSQSIGAE